MYNVKPPRNFCQLNGYLSITYPRTIITQVLLIKKERDIQMAYQTRKE